MKVVKSKVVREILLSFISRSPLVSLRISRFQIFFFFWLALAQKLIRNLIYFERLVPNLNFKMSKITNMKNLKKFPVSHFILFLRYELSLSILALAQKLILLVAPDLNFKNPKNPKSHDFK